MNTRRIHTPADYKAALKDVSALIDRDPAPGTPQGDRLDVLTTVIQAYEAQYFPIDAPDLVQAPK